MSFWICADERPSSTHFYYFEKDFEVKAGAKMTAKVCGDTRYQLYLNDTLVSEGPCQGSRFVRYYEDVDLTPYLKEGVNHFRAKVMYCVEGAFISVMRGSRPALWVDATLTQDGETSQFGTDDTWTCMRDDSVNFYNVPGVHTSVPQFEEVLGDTVLTPVKVCNFYVPNVRNQSYDIFGLGEYYPLTPRPIPPMEEFPAKPMKVVRKGDGWVELDAGMYTTAKVNINLKGREGGFVRVIYSECYTVENEHGHRVKADRADYNKESSRLDGAWDTIHTTGKEQSFRTFWYRAFRFIRVEFGDDKDFDLSSITYNTYFYPMDYAGKFTCSNPRYDRMWEISRNTVLCCMHEMYVDCPFYEQQQYDMDSNLEMLFTFRMTGDARMPLKCITDMAHSQMADGMIQANYPSTGVQVITGFTLFWVMMVRDYLRYAGYSKEAIKEVRKLSGNVDKALEAFDALLTKDGLVGATPYWSFVDWVPGWIAGIPAGGINGWMVDQPGLGEEEPLTVYCLMYSTALQSAAEMAEAIGRPELAIEYRRRAEAMNEAVNRLCYDEEAGLYRNTATRREFSEHTSLWAVLSGAVKGEAAGELMDRTLDGHIPVSRCTFSMNHFMLRALEKAGRYQYAPQILEGWHKMLDMNCTTWCENPDSPRSECHGWSSAPAYELSSMVLGAYPTGNGYSSVRIRPYIEGFGLDWVKGTVPTPVGEIEIAWEKKDGTFALDVKLPVASGMDATIEMPDGTTYKMDAQSGHYEMKL